MAKNVGKSASHKRRRLSLQNFAGIGKSKYDRKAKTEKQQAINAGRVNKYRMLKHKLLVSHNQERNSESQKRVRPNSSADDPDTRRAKSRAGPPPEESDEGGRDSVGGSSSSEADGDHKTAATLGRENGPARGDTKAFPRVAQQEAAPEQRANKDKGAFEADTEAQTEVKKPRKRQKRPKPPSQLQRLAAKVSATKEEKQKLAALRAKEEAARQKRLDKAERHRKKRREIFLKKTKKGQPVMKHRIDNLLSKLQAE